MPRNIVAAVLYALHVHAERRRKSVRDSWRNFLTEWVEEYAEAWDALSTPTDQVKRPVSENITGLIAKFGRPEDRLLIS